MTLLSEVLTPSTPQNSPSHSAAHNALHGIYNTFFEPLANSIVVPSKLGGGSLVSSGTLSAASSSVLFSESKAASWVLADFSLIAAGDSVDSGAVRAMAFQTAAFTGTLIRGLETHGVRYAAVGQGGTWAIEAGVHTGVAGDGLNYNIGIYLNSNADFLPAGGVRADVGLLVLGTLGWTHPIQVRDVDNTSYLFDVDQYGHIGIHKIAAAGYMLDIAAAAADTIVQARLAATGTGSAYLGLSSAGGVNSFLTDAAGDWSLSSDAVAGSVLKMIHAAAVAFTLVLSKGSVIVHQGTALNTNATDGFLYLPTMAGAPSGTPTASTGNVAMVYDTTNNKLMVYDGGWIGVLLA